MILVPHVVCVDNFRLDLCVRECVYVCYCYYYYVNI